MGESSLVVHVVQGRTHFKQHLQYPFLGHRSKQILGDFAILAILSHYVMIVIVLEVLQKLRNMLMFKFSMSLNLLG